MQQASTKTLLRLRIGCISAALVSFVFKLAALALDEWGLLADSWSLGCWSFHRGGRHFSYDSRGYTYTQVGGAFLIASGIPSILASTFLLYSTARSMRQPSRIAKCIMMDRRTVAQALAFGACALIQWGLVGQMNLEAEYESSYSIHLSTSFILFCVAWGCDFILAQAMKRLATHSAQFAPAAAVRPVAASAPALASASVPQAASSAVLGSSSASVSAPAASTVQLQMAMQALAANPALLQATLQQAAQAQGQVAESAAAHVCGQCWRTRGLCSACTCSLSPSTACSRCVWPIQHGVAAGL